eukprot:gene5793-9021_t
MHAIRRAFHTSLLVQLYLFAHHVCVMGENSLPPPGGGPYLSLPATRSNTGGNSGSWNGRYDAGGPSVVQSNTPNGFWPDKDNATTSSRFGLCGGLPSAEPRFLTSEPISLTAWSGSVLNMSFVTDNDQPPGHVIFRICDGIHPHIPNLKLTVNPSTLPLPSFWLSSRLCLLISLFEVK